MTSAGADPLSDHSVKAAADQAMAVLTDSGLHLLIDSQAMAQSVYLYRPVFDSSGERIVDLEIVLLNDAARMVPLAHHIVEGMLASEVYVDTHLAIEAAQLAWYGERASAYQIERRGIDHGQHIVVRYEIATFRVASYIVQVSVDHTSLSQLASADTRFRLMAEASIDGLVLLTIVEGGRDFLVSYMNPAAITNEPLMKVGEMLPPGPASFVRRSIAGLAKGSPKRVTVRRDILARHVVLEITFTLVDDEQVMMSAREMTTEESARAELERSDRVLQAVGRGSFGTIAVFEPTFAGVELADLQLLWTSAGQGPTEEVAPLDPTAVLSAAELLQMAREMLAAGELKRSGWVPISSDGIERSVEFAFVLAGDRFVLEFLERTEELAVRTALAMVTATAEAQRSFLSRVSHELRSPLNVIHGYSQLLARTRLPGAANDHVEHIDRGVRRMVQIIDDLLLLGQLDQGLLRVDEYPVDLRDITADVLSAAGEQPWFVAGCVSSIPVSATAVVRTDRARFATVVLLLAEASRHADDMASLEVGPFVRGTRAGLQLVAPSSSPLVAEVWSPFVGSHTIPGSGMGLAVARGLANVLGITVEVRQYLGDPDRSALVMMLNPVT